MAIFPLALGTVVLWLIQWWAKGDMTKPLAFWFLPVPLMLYLYLRRTEPDSHALYRPPMLPLAFGCLLAFVAAAFTVKFWQLGWLLLAVGSGAFVFIDPKALRTHVARHARLTIAAFLGGFAGVGHILAQVFWWKSATTATANTVLLFLHKFIPDMSVFEKGHRLIYGTVPHPPVHRFHYQVPVRIYYRVNPNKPPEPKLPAPPEDPHVYLNFMAVASNNLVMRFYIFENVLNGIFILIFMLSVALLMRGQKLERQRLATLYFGGVLLVFAVNAVLMTLIFVIGHLAKAKGAAGSLTWYFGKGIGFMLSSRVICLLAFVALAGLFIAWLYHPKAFRIPRLRRTKHR